MMAKQVSERRREAAGYPWRAPVGRGCRWDGCKPSLLWQEHCPRQPWVISNCIKIPDMDCRITILPKESLRGGTEESLSVILTCWADVQAPSVLQPWEHWGCMTALMLSTSHLALCCRARVRAAAPSAAGEVLVSHTIVWKEVRWTERFYWGRTSERSKERWFSFLPDKHRFWDPAQWSGNPGCRDPKPAPFLGNHSGQGYESTLHLLGKGICGICDLYSCCSLFHKYTKVRGSLLWEESFRKF